MTTTTPAGDTPNTGLGPWWAALADAPAEARILAHQIDTLDDHHHGLTLNLEGARQMSLAMCANDPDALTAINRAYDARIAEENRHHDELVGALRAAITALTAGGVA